MSGHCANEHLDALVETATATDRDPLQFIHRCHRLAYGPDFTDLEWTEHATDEVVASISIHRDN